MSVFAKKIYSYIGSEYGKKVLKNVQSAEHKSVVEKILTSSEKQEDTIQHAGNKIIAMLRLNP